MAYTAGGEPTLERRHPPALWDWVSVGLFAGLVVVAFSTFTDYGTSWDEREHIRYGDDIVRYFASGMSKDAVPDHHEVYGGGFNLAAAWFSKLVPHPRHTANHLFNALVGLAGMLGTWRLGRLLGGPATGLLSLILVCCLPAYYGHMFNNPKDIPFAAGYVWMLYYLCRLIQAGPQAPFRLWLSLAVATGLAMTVRIGGVLGLGYLAVIVGLQWFRFATRETEMELRAKLLVRLAFRSLLVAGVGWILMLLPWPATHRDPVMAPLRSLSRLGAYGFDTVTLLRGQYVRPNPPPWDYLPSYFAVQLPDVLWLILAMGAAMLVVQLARWRKPLALWSWRAAAMALLLVAILFPITFAIVRGSTIYDGLRHFLFVLPPLCAVAALATSSVLKWLADRWRPAAYAAAAVLALGVVAVVVDMVQLHPYQYVYFNRASGGLRAAATQYETEYYAHSFKELGERLADHLWNTERDRYLNGDYKVLGCGMMDYFLLDHLPAHFLVAREPPLLWRPHDYDFYAGYRRLGCNERRANLPTIVAVERQGVVLNVMRDWRGAR